MKLLKIAPLMLLAGCAGDAVESANVGKDYKVDRLFEHEGCRVYRFWDAAGWVYYTNCRGQTGWTESCGKNCSRSVSVPTGLE